MNRKELLREAALEINRIRWARIPKDERAQHVPHNGGRPRQYPPCPKKYNGRDTHRFRGDRCPCGYVRTATVLSRPD